MDYDKEYEITFVSEDGLNEYDVKITKKRAEYFDNLQRKSYASNSNDNDSEVIYTEDNKDEYGTFANSKFSIKNWIKRLIHKLDIWWYHNDKKIICACMAFAVITMAIGIFLDNELFILYGTVFSITYGIFTANFFNKHEEGYRKWTGASLDNRQFLVSLCLGIGTFVYVVVTIIIWVIEHFSIDSTYCISKKYFCEIHFITNILMVSSLFLIVIDNWKKHAK